MKQQDPRARILELATTRGVSLAALSALISRNGTYLQQFVRKGSPRKLEEGDRRTLARFFDVAEAELGAMENPDQPASARQSDWCDVPRLALGVSAGPGALAAEEGPIGAFRFATRWLRQQGFDPARLTTIIVSGDSMEPTLRDGDEILVDGTPAAPPPGSVQVVRVGEALLVKRLGAAEAGRVVLTSDNTAYDPLDLAAAEVEVIGRVVWKSGRL